MKQVWVGIDVSKKSLDAAIWIGDKARTRKEPNTGAGFQRLLKWMHQVAGEALLRVCMEATGDYGFNAALFFSEQGVKVSIVNPAWVKHFGKSKGRQNKTDKADAKLLAEYAQKHNPEEWYLRSQTQRNLFRLVRRRRQLSDAITAECNRRECPEAIGAECMASIKTILKALRQEKRKVEKLIRELIAGSPELKRRYDVLRSMAGEISSFVILAELPDVDDCKDPTTYAACAGVNPSGRQSGESPSTGRMSRAGSSYARGTLTLPMMRAKRQMPELRDLYDRLKARGKRHKQCTVACIRKFLMIAYAIQKSGKPYAPRTPKEKLSMGT